MVEENNGNNVTENKNSTQKYYVIAVSVLTVLLVASILTQGFATITGAYIAKDAAGKSTIEFINTQLLQGQAEAELIEITESGSLYSIEFTIEGEEYSMFVTKDGKYLFPQAIPMSGNATTPEAEQQTSFDAPDKEKPVVELFVMSFCPYGIQAENAIDPVYRLLKDKVTFEPHFIVSISDGKIDSLHGEAEANEDMRQVVIFKHYSEKFWDYLAYVNSKCSLETIDSCWKDAAESVSLDVAEIEQLVEDEGMELMQAEADKTEAYGVRGSPTIIVNGETYSGGRTAEALKSGICTGFTNVPEECAEVLSDEAATSSGSC